MIAARRPQLKRVPLGGPVAIPEGQDTDAAQCQSCPAGRLRQLAFAAWLLSASACTWTWQGRSYLLNGRLGLGDQVRLWVRGEAHQVHGVRVLGDTVIAVPFDRPPTCDSCALRFARADIDSVQMRASTWGPSLAGAFFMAPVLYLYWVLLHIPRD